MKRLSFALIVQVLVVSFAFPQNLSSIVGVWERTMLKSVEGQTLQPPAPAAILILTANGRFTQIAIPNGRPRRSKALRDMTREELITQFDNVAIRYGTYRIDNNKITRRDISNLDPNQEGSEAIQLFRIDGDTLVLSTLGKVDTAWFKRVK